MHKKGPLRYELRKLWDRMARKDFENDREAAFGALKNLDIRQMEWLKSSSDLGSAEHREDFVDAVSGRYTTLDQFREDVRTQLGGNGGAIESFRVPADSFRALSAVINDEYLPAGPWLQVAKNSNAKTGQINHYSGKVIITVAGEEGTDVFIAPDSGITNKAIGRITERTGLYSKDNPRLTLPNLESIGEDKLRSFYACCDSAELKGNDLSILGFYPLDVSPKVIEHLETEPGVLGTFRVDGDGASRRVTEVIGFDGKVYAPPGNHTSADHDIKQLVKLGFIDLGDLDVTPPPFEAEARFEKQNSVDRRSTPETGDATNTPPRKPRTPADPEPRKVPGASLDGRVPAPPSSGSRSPTPDAGQAGRPSSAGTPKPRPAAPDEPRAKPINLFEETAGTGGPNLFGGPPDLKSGAPTGGTPDTNVDTPSVKNGRVWFSGWGRSKSGPPKPSKPTKPDEDNAGGGTDNIFGGPPEV